MGYFKDLHELKRGHMIKKQPYPDLGERELKTAEAFNGVFYKAGDGSEPPERKGEVFEEVTQGEDGTRKTRLILQDGGETVAVAKEWEETGKNGSREAYANVVFNKKYSMGEPGKDNEDYTVHKHYNADERVTMLEENDIKKYIDYYNSGQVGHILWERSSGEGITEEFNIKDMDSFSYDKGGRPRSERHVSFGRSLPKSTGHIDQNTDITIYSYGREANGNIYMDAEGEFLIGKTEVHTVKELEHGIPKESDRKYYTEEELSFIDKFDKDPNIPKGFTKMKVWETRVTYGIGGKTEERIITSEDRYGGSSRLKTGYHKNGNEKVTVSEEFRINEGKKTEVKEFSEQGKLIREWLTGNDKTVSPEEIYRVKKDFSREEEKYHLQKRGTREKSRIDFIGIVEKLDITNKRYALDESGKMRTEEKNFTSREDANTIVMTEFSKGEKVHQSVTIDSPDDGRRYVIEKNFENGRASGRKVTVNGKETPDEEVGDMITVRRSKSFGAFGREETSIQYDDNGNMRSAEEIVFDRDGKVTSTASYSREEDGISMVRCDSEGCVEESCFYKDDGKHRCEQFLCETKNTRVFALEGKAEIKESLHEESLSEECPAALTYDMETRTVMINTREGADISAVKIAKTLWGERAAGDDRAAHSPDGKHPKELLNAVQAVENAVEPAVTSERAKELSEIRHQVSKKLRINIREREIPIDTFDIR